MQLVSSTASATTLEGCSDSTYTLLSQYNTSSIAPFLAGWPGKPLPTSRSDPDRCLCASTLSPTPLTLPFILCHLHIRYRTPARTLYTLHHTLLLILSPISHRDSGITRCGTLHQHVHGNDLPLSEVLTSPPRSEVAQLNIPAALGAFVAFENVAEWFVSWLPFYWEFRTVFLLFMALEQTQGSTWFYNTYLQPFFSKNEADIDAGIVSAQMKAAAFLQSKLGSVWEALWRFATTHGAAPPQAMAPSATKDTTQPAPGRTSFYALGVNVFNTYGPWAMGAISRTVGVAQPVAPRTPDASAPQSQVTPSPGMQQRKSYVAAEDASDQSAPPPSFPVPQHY
ncbi:hypothetical protein NM688_g2025 [Phlebia brevispora]|uniref:Uncharacterized protein n=1 Tax=Phlebia brevispora TaxID=194682 RepID=A0ACC1T9X8_9APHY|nr:hypothetical protein NM688_g2025 [Phlebia brevispora]